MSDDFKFAVLVLIIAGAGLWGGSHLVQLLAAIFKFDLTPYSRWLDIKAISGSAIFGSGVFLS